MELDLELYRKDIRLPGPPPLRLSAIDVSPDCPQHTLVLLHGFGGQASQWRYQLQALSLENRVIALDLRGHGRSDKPRGSYTMDQVLTDLLAALDALGVHEPFVLAGHSFGGAAASEFASRYPERVEKLILIASAGEFHLNPLYRLALRLPPALLRALSPLARGQLSAPPHVLQPWYANNLSKWNGWSLFRSISAPTLVVRGHLDLVLERPAFEEVTRAIPGAEEVDVGASGHMVMLERREAVNRAIERFLDSDTRAKARSWRATGASPETDTRAALLHERPWLAHYETGVPYTVALPRVALQALLGSAARRFPLRPAILFEGARLTYRRLELEANRFAHALRGLGVQKGDRVLLLLPNLPQMVIAFFGILKAGGVAVFALPTTQPEELARQAEEAEARVLVTLPRFAAAARQMMERVQQHLLSNELSSEGGLAPQQHIIFCDAGDYLPAFKRAILRWRAPRRENPSAGAASAAAEEHDFRGLIAHRRSDPPDGEISASDLAVIHFTGGTTADPKGVMLTHANLTANTLQTRAWMPGSLEGRERFLCALPFSHSYGLATALLVPVALGAAMILKTGFEAIDILKTIKSARPTIFPGVPRMYVAINDFRGARKFGIRSIRACISGSAPLPVEVQEAFEKLTRGRLVEGYGLTEASPVTHANPLNGLRKVGSIGVPLPSTEAKIVDLAHPKKDAPLGQIGELAVRGPQVMLGYWKNPAATRQTILPDGWLLTGDVAQMDAEGYFRIIARKAEMWYPDKPEHPAFPRDVEEVLYEVPQVKEAAVVAIAGQPVAFVIAKKERPSAESLLAYCRRRLPPELTPRLIIFLDDFPRTFIGKVLRRELAKKVESE